MLKNTSKLINFNLRTIEKENISHKQALRIFEALFKEAVSLGVINSRNILDGLEVDLRISKIVSKLPINIDSLLNKISSEVNCLET